MKKIPFLLFLLLVIGCKKEKPITPTPLTPIVNGCLEMYDITTEPYSISIVKTDLPECMNQQHTYPENSEYAYVSVKVNPSNPFEILFLRRNFLNGNTDPNNHELGIYNFCTNSKNILKTNLFFSYIDWTKDNWIIFNEIGEFKKIKPNGQNIENISVPSLVGISDYIKYNPNNTILLACDISHSKVYISNEEGEFTTPLPLNTSHADWYSNNEIIYFENNEGFKIYNIDSEEIISWGDFNAINILQNGFYVSENKVFLANLDGFYELGDTYTTLLDSNYESFHTKSVQPLNENLFLLQRNIYDITDPCNLKMYKYASIFNRSTQTEKMIQIP